MNFDGLRGLKESLRRQENEQRTVYHSIGSLQSDTVQAFAAASASVAPPRARSVSESLVLLDLIYFQYYTID